MADCWINPLEYVREVGRCIVTEGLWPPVKIHICYWWCFDSNIQGLRDKIDSLESDRRNMDRKIEAARLRAQSATTEVKNWLKEGTDKLDEAKRILQGCDDLKVWNIIDRYLKGKSAKEKAQGIEKLLNDRQSIVVADPAPPASMVSISHPPTSEFESRRHIQEHIMESLKDGNVRMIAICGPGGVGKTTMVEIIEERVKNEKLFDEVVNVVVSQQTDTLKIQKHIAERLLLGLSEDTLVGRAHILRTRLMDSKKKLIIFDDVWESFEPEHIGIPFEGCKIILASRLKDVCEEMEADKVLEIKVLDKIEAWTLFREKSGDCVDDLDLRPIAEDVAAECKGLPIALVTVGKALKMKNIKTWRDALFQLRRASPTNFPKVLKYVYMPLKLSYDFLETRSEKDLFLLCCLFPDDYNIPIEDLTLISFGLGLLEGINNIEDGRNRTYHLLERLRSRFLLMTGRHEGEVKMHDVVRDVAIFIGSKEKLSIGFLKSLEVDLSSKDSSRNCNWMSVDIWDIANAKLPLRLDFPNLHLLMILNSRYFKIPKGFDANVIPFKGMEELIVLYFSNQNLQPLPSSLKLLKKLRKLNLEDCWELKDMSVVGELASLEILRVRWCNNIEELPANVGKLNFLRLLELDHCGRLERIVSGVISSLVALEELKIIHCAFKWEPKGNLRNASLSELESLPNLTLLQIDRCDPSWFDQEICLSQHLVRYQIRSSKRYIGYDMKCEREIELYLPRPIMVGDWICQLIKNTQSLSLLGDDGSNYFNLGEIETCPNLHYLFPMAKLQLQSHQILSCDTIEQVFPNETESNTEASVIEFPKLKQLRLYRLPNLVAFTQGVEIIATPQLIELQIWDCPKLRIKIGKFPNNGTIELSNFNIVPCHLFSSHCMIERLVVCECGSIEEIFWDETQDDGNHHIIFPELMKLELRDLSSLTTFYRGAESIKFPKLEELRIGNLPRLNSLAPMDSEPTHDHHSLHFFCNKNVEIIGLKSLWLWNFPDNISNIWCRHVPINFFHTLERLNICKVDGIRNSISSSIAKALVNLYFLNVEDCNGMVDVIEDETHVPVNSIFPNLRTLLISRNCRLRSFCQWTHAFELPSLEVVSIAYCPLWKDFTLGLLSIPKLRRFSYNYKDIQCKTEWLYPSCDNQGYPGGYDVSGGASASGAR